MVIAIIALLVALLMPMLSRAKGLARQAACYGNLHAIGLAAMLYAEYNEQYIPRGISAQHSIPYFQSLLPYVPGEGTRADYRRIQVFRCPSHPEPGQIICYVINDWQFSSLSDPSGRDIGKPTPIDDVDRPAETTYMTDSEHGWWRPVILGMNDPDIVRNDIFHPDQLPTSDRENLTYGRRVARDRHLDGFNLVYFDGHAGWMAPETMTVTMWRTERDGP